MVTTLARVREQDKELLREWRNQPDVSRWMYSSHHISSEEHTRWFGDMMGDATKRYSLISWEGRPVGLVHLSAISEAHRRAEWGIYLADPTVRGQGVAQAAVFLSLDEAFGDLNLQRVTCESLEKNASAIRLYERMGFRREGHRRSHICRDGEMMDVVPFGILATDWETVRDGLARSLLARHVLRPG